MFRKIIAPKFFITLPKAWRESLGLEPGGFIDPRFSAGSPLILIPKGHDLTVLEESLIAVLTSPGSLSKIEISKLIDRLALVAGSLRELLRIMD